MMVGLLTALALIVLPAMCVHNARRERQRRGDVFADAMHLFDRLDVTQEGPQFPVLEGRYRGFRVRLEPVLDDIGVRKVPSLWLKATLLVSNPTRGVLDFIVRPQGNEVYSPSHDLPCRVPVPTDWPQHAILCTDDTDRLPDIAMVTPHMRVFEDPRTKELLITPRGLRLVYQAAQGQRGEYLVLRQARFAKARIDPGLIKALLDRLIALAIDLDGAVEIAKTDVA